MQQAEGRFSLWLQRTPVGPDRLQQLESAHDIGLHKCPGSVDGTIHMAFCCEMQDRAGLVLGE